MTKPQEGRPADRIKILLDGQEKTLFMSFGLLNELCRMYGDVHTATQVPLNADLRDVTLITLLSPRDENGMIPEGKEVRLNLLDMPLDDGDKLLSWASEHAIYFFVTALKRVVEAQKSNAALKELIEISGVKLVPEASTTSSSGTAS
jgi:hypothetical protein